MESHHLTSRTLRWPLSPVLALLLSFGNCPGWRSQAAVFVVTSTVDSGPGTLRQAMIEANTNGVPDVIGFNISGGGTHTINLTAALPQIDEPVTIDGFAQPGYSGAPLIELNGVNSGQSAGLRVAAGKCLLRGLVLNRFEGGGIRLLNGDSNVVQGCYIGTDLVGTGVQANGEFGIWISGGSTGNLIGGSGTTERNVISGNTKAGIYVQASPSNSITGNIIGLAANGLVPLPNGNNGVIVDNSAGTRVGGTDTGEGNVVSGNVDGGVYLLNSTGASVQGNWIGLSSDGSIARSNSADGLRVFGGSGHLIGGTEAGAGNVISGNGGAGIFLLICTEVTVQGNLLGMDQTGTEELGNGLAGVTLQGGSGNLVGGSLIAARNVISGNVQDGLYLTNSSGNRIEGNWIGLDGVIGGALPNGFNGITLNDASGNVVGGAAVGAGNVVSGNAGHGVSILGGSTSNWVCGNFIGVDATGSAARPNLLSGVRLLAGDNLIGGAAAAARNVISGNGLDGISVESVNAAGNRIQGNRIGTTPAGTADLGNGRAGIGISGAPGTIIGGSTSGEGNLVSGNDGDAGIFLVGSDTSQTVVQGNRIGTSADGNSAIPNRYEGIYLQDSATNIIGGVAQGAGNLISGNRTIGIFLTNASGNVIQGNLIGAQSDGSSALGHPFHAIEIEFGSVGNLIGGSEAGAGNRIGHSLTIYSGVRVRNGASGNAIRGNAIFANGGLGIDLGTYQASPNDECDGDAGANQSQNFPVLSRAAVSDSAMIIEGELNSAVGQLYEIDFFGSAVADSSGYGEGEVYLGSKTVSIPAGPDCAVSFVAGLNQSVPAGWKISATATDSMGNTSEFAPVVDAGLDDAIHPLLDIEAGSQADVVQLSWSSPYSAFDVSVSENLSPPVVWEVVTNAPVFTNGQWNVELPVDQNTPHRYYRLILE